MSFTRDLLVGLATLLNSSGVATYRSDDSNYAAGESAVVFSLTPQTPDRCVVLAVYNVIDQVENSLSQLPVQFRFRGSAGDPNDVDDFADLVFQQIHGLSDVVMGSSYLVQILRKSSVPLGQDASRRWERTDNYYADLNVPVTARRPY